MKCCNLCDKISDHQLNKVNGPRSIFNSLFPFSVENLAASASLFVNTPHLRDMMMAACLLRGYFQPAGPLIHLQASNSVSTKSQNLTNLDSASTAESQLPSSSSEDHAEAAIRSGENPVPPPPPPPPSAAHHMGYPRGYPPYQAAYYQGGYYPPPPQSAHYQPPPPSFHHHYHHHQDLCYPPGYPPSSYPPPPPSSYRRFLQPPPSYYSPELTYGSSGPPPSQDSGAQQMVVPGGSSSSYSAPLESYPPPAPYYPGYSAGPTSACYSHPPPSRNLAFIEQTYQSCPCPMQLCPKNVHIGPLTGECKRPGALPLPPVALQLPQEPPGATGPPSPARGSAGMPPQPSPVSVSPRPNWDGKQNKSSAEMKWEESKEGLEFKRSKYKTEILNCDKGIWDLSSRKRFLTDSDKSVKSAEVQWNNVIDDKIKDSAELCGQGLLAISSKEIMQKTARIQDFTEPSVKVSEEFKKIKKETTAFLKEDFNSCNLEYGPQKINLCGNIPQPIADRKRSIETFEQIDSLEGNRKRKRKSDTANENSENNVKKGKKSGLIKQKDENLYAHKEASKKKKKLSNLKVTKLLRDRNQTIDRRERNGNKIRTFGKEDLKVNKINETEEGINDNVRIIVRRKSAQERSKDISEIGAQSVRKSKSCSPSRCKSQENVPARLLRDDAKKKQEGIKLNKCKPEARAKGLHEYSEPTVKKNNGTAIVKGGKQVSFLNKNSQNCSSAKSKKSKSECAVGAVALKKSTLKKASSSSPRTGIVPKWSNGWSWDSESFDAKVYLTNDEAPVMRKCYTAMRHVQGDVIHPKDCILLKAGTRKIDLPFVAKVAALWENPDDGEMMVSLLWYYRPEHTDQGRQPSDQQDEIFASRHKDINSVACIEDKCFVLTYNEYCRYRKKVRRVEEGAAEKNASVPRLEQPYFRSQRQPPCVMAPDMVFFCRRVYDFRQKRLLKNPT